MAGRRPIGAVDTIWLNMDRPNNLMVIDGVMWLDGPLDVERLADVLRRRLVARFPVFSQRPLMPLAGLGVPHWEDDPEFDLDWHLRRVRLREPGDETALQAFVEEQVCRPLDREHPLWEFHLVEDYRGGSAIMSRFHHALADGVALTEVLLSLTDATPDADLEDDDEPSPLRVPGQQAPSGLIAGAGHLVGATTSTALGLASGGLHLLSELPHLAQPQTAFDALTLALQTGHIADKLVLGHNPQTPLSGTPGIAKRTVWSAPHSLPQVKEIGRQTGATVNDVIVSVVSGALSSYMVEHGGVAVDVTTMVPVNVRPPGPLPRELGNQFALVMLPLATGLTEPLARLARTKERMDAIKHSPEATITFGLITAIGRTHPELERRLVDFFSAKAIGVTTNVAGPMAGRYIAGARIEGVLGWVPGSGRQTVGVSAFTYAGTLRVGFKVDAEVVADPESLVEAFDDQLDDLATMTATG
jgi:WS/DGAT/MGAT family acyltransferase